MIFLITYSFGLGHRGYIHISLRGILRDAGAGDLSKKTKTTPDEKPPRRGRTDVLFGMFSNTTCHWLATNALSSITQQSHQNIASDNNRRQTACIHSIGTQNSRSFVNPPPPPSGTERKHEREKRLPRGILKGRGGRFEKLDGRPCGEAHSQDFWGAPVAFFFLVGGGAFTLRGAFPQGIFTVVT